MGRGWSPTAERAAWAFGLRGRAGFSSSKGNAQNVLISSDGNSVLGDFGLHGLQESGVAWATLTGLNPEQIVVG